MPRDVGVVVVAAGRGTRLGGETPKQYRPVGGVPIVLRALRPFTSHPDVVQVALVLPSSDAANPPRFLAELMGEALTIVPGGAERSDSVAAGLAALRPECAVVLVHDGTRPFVDRNVIDAVIAHARSGEGAVAAVPIADTVKEAAAHDPTRIERTLPRERLWRAQTPQGFPRARLESALTRAAGESRRATDDAALVEACGGTVRLVPDSSRNLKITTPVDLAVAEVFADRPR
ncbi:MAG: 2-C-methyl-D-erythritol 4-phosphate cytidylyltransferase [Gemmatimonadales bacterium]